MQRILRCSQRYILSFLAMAFLHHAQSQDILYIAPGTDLSISPGTPLTIDLLTLTPSAAFTLNGFTVTKNTTITHPAINTYISRVYAFSGTTGPFSGDIQMGYQDGAELNGLSEANLQLNVYNGSGWQSFPASQNNTVSNFVLTPVSNVTLNELTLAAASAPLPLNWGLIRAYRRNGQLLIEWETLQENNVADFTIEKSFDGTSWSPIILDIPARNQSLPQQYQQTDPVYSPQRVFYRIREADLDAHYSYSAVVVVSAENSREAFVLFPNPVGDRFYLSGDNLAGIKQLQLFSGSGALLKTWDGSQDSYRVDQFAAGVYYVRITKTDGSIQYETMIKK